MILHKQSHGGQLAGLVVSLLLAFVAISALRAHDTGFGHSRRTIFLAAQPAAFVLEYRVRQNMDEALIEMTLMDRNHDAQVSTAERDAYFTQRAGEFAQGLRVQTGAGEALKLDFVRYELEASLVQVFHFTIATPAPAILLEDRAFPHKPGWVQIRAGAGLTVETIGPVDLSHADAIRLKITRAGV